MESKPTDDKVRAEDKPRLDFAEPRRRKTKSKAVIEGDGTLQSQQ